MKMILLVLATILVPPVAGNPPSRPEPVVTTAICQDSIKDQNLASYWYDHPMTAEAERGLDTTVQQYVVLRVRGIDGVTGEVVPHVRYFIKYFPDTIVTSNGVEPVAEQALYSRGNCKESGGNVVNQRQDEDGDYSVVRIPLPVGRDYRLSIQPEAVEYAERGDGTLYERSAGMTVMAPIVFNTADLRGRQVYTFPQDVVFYPVDSVPSNIVE